MFIFLIQVLTEALFKIQLQIHHFLKLTHHLPKLRFDFSCRKSATRVKMDKPKKYCR